MENGMPVVGEEYPGGEEESVFLATFPDHPGQAREFQFRKNPPPRQKTARNEEPTVGYY
jgi:hypothetical protein